MDAEHPDYARRYSTAQGFAGEGKGWNEEEMKPLNKASEGHPDQQINSYPEEQPPHYQSGAGKSDDTRI